MFDYFDKLLSKQEIKKYKEIMISAHSAILTLITSFWA